MLGRAAALSSLLSRHLTKGLLCPGVVHVGKCLHSLFAEFEVRVSASNLGQHRDSCAIFEFAQEIEGFFTSIDV